MNTRGFVKLPRSLLEWRWYGDLNTRSLYIHLLMTAAWDDAVYMNREIKRGQCCTTVKELAAINQRTIQQTRTALNHLVSTNDITIEATTQFSIITLTNYDELQPVGKPPADSFSDRPTLAVGEFHHLRTYCGPASSMTKSSRSVFISSVTSTAVQAVIIGKNACSVRPAFHIL